MFGRNSLSATSRTLLTVRSRKHRELQNRSAERVAEKLR